VAFAQAKGDVVITMDADLQDSPDEIPSCIFLQHFPLFNQFFIHIQYWLFFPEINKQWINNW